MQEQINTFTDEIPPQIRKNLNSVSQIIKNEEISIPQDYQLDDETSVLNKVLKDYLLDLTLIPQNTPKKVKIIILFKEYINSDKRIESTI